MEIKPEWTRLSLDLGTNSIGWMLFELDKPNRGNPVGIIKSGVRIFPSGRTPQDLSLNKSRREARGARRLRARYLQRRKHLMEAMIKHGLMPEDKIERKALQKLNPFELRAAAVERELPPHHVGRALFHLNQRRGFKSNRIQIMGDDKEEKNDSKIVGQAIKEFRKKLSAEGSKTLGAYLWRLQQKDESVRARRREGGLYDFYPDRKMLVDEFNQIWDKQSETQPSIFNGGAQKKIKEIIFKQRPWTSPPPGKCTYDPNEERAHRASPIFQEYRVWQTLSNLEIRVIGRSTPYRFTELKQETQDEILKKLSKQKSMPLSALKTILKRTEKIEEDISFNFEEEILGDETGAAVRKAGWPENFWFEWSLSEREDFIDCLLNYKPEDNEKCINKLVGSLGLDIDIAGKGIKAVAFLPTGHAKLSKKVMEQILRGMKEGKDWHSAKAKFEAEFAAVSQFGDGEKDKLPYYAEVIERYTVERKPNEENSKERDPRIPNPTVHIALNQLRKVVNDIIRIYGKPQEIYLELARDLPLGEIAKRKLESRNKKNRKKREDARKCLEELGMPTNNEKNIERVLMWKELGESLHDRRCVYTGETISKSKLFSDKIQIDHILPRKPFCDDSKANKILVYQKANQYKGNRTPEEAFKNSEEYDWEDILKRAQKLPAGKRKRFYKDARERFLGERKFLDNQLTDTSYIGKVAKEYLTAICPKNKVRVRPGRLTGQLRYAWGLNSILGENNKKRREDHRHHAVDAAVVGITNEPILQDIATAFQDEDKKRLVDAIESVDRPWESFYDDVQKSIDGIIVSHKPSRKASGKLHEAYAYGIIEDSNPDGSIKLFRHKSLNDLSKEDFRNIVNKKLMEKLSDLLPNGTQEMEAEELRKKLETLGNPKKKIRRVRIKESPSKIIPIRHKKGGKPYKYFKPGSNWAYEIFCLEGTWHGEIISLFDAAKGAKFTPEWHANPHAEEVMRIHKNDMLILEIEKQKKIVYVKSISENDISFIEHNKANANENIRVRGISKLQEANARKIHVSPSGLVYDPGPPTPQE